MAFTVEDGTGVADANSFGAVADADAYFTERGVAAWTGVQAVKEGALIRATDYIETRFGARFKGTKVDEDQSLSFPREDADEFDEDEIPRNLKRATFEYALRALTAELAPDPVIDPSGVAVVTTRKKLGPMEKEFQVLGSGTPKLLRAYPAADMLLAPLLVPGGNRVIR